MSFELFPRQGFVEAVLSRCLEEIHQIFLDMRIEVNRRYRAAAARKACVALVSLPAPVDSGVGEEQAVPLVPAPRVAVPAPCISLPPGGCEQAMLACNLPKVCWYIFPVATPGSLLSPIIPSILFTKAVLALVDKRERVFGFFPFDPGGLPVCLSLC